MRETRTYGSEGGGTERNSLPLFLGSAMELITRTFGAEARTRDISGREYRATSLLETLPIPCELYFQKSEDTEDNGNSGGKRPVGISDMASVFLPTILVGREWTE